MNQIEDLKPCPFCGGEPEISFDEDTWTVECRHHEWAKTDEKDIRVAADIAVYSDVEGNYDFDEKKQVYTPDEIERARRKVVEEWNRRAERTCHTVDYHIDIDEGCIASTCSECGELLVNFDFEQNPPKPVGYCPNCGAKVAVE